MKKKMIVVLNVVGLSPELLETRKSAMPNITAFVKDSCYRKMNPTFPAVTCSSQASLLTGKPPRDHGIVGNGFFCRDEKETMFWKQPSYMVTGPRVWNIMRERDPKSKVAVFFWQNSKFIDADIVVTPAPQHTDTGMVEWCYSKPPMYYENAAKEIGEFKLMSYWGPMAGEASSRWISKAALRSLKADAADMTLVYLPHLDYNLQRLGPNSPAIEKDLKVVDDIVGEFMAAREAYGRDEMVIFLISEYGMVPVKRPVFPNRALREAGLLKVREIGGKEYIDFELSRAFAVVDHQVAHIYCAKDAVKEAQNILSNVPGISEAAGAERIRQLECGHHRAGDLLLLAEKDSWFAYYYWNDESKAPFYARTVDIHNKPGYDPCELFVDMKTRSIPIAPEMVRGSHGLPAETDAQKAVFASSAKEMEDYVPKELSMTQFLAMMYRVM